MTSEPSPRPARSERLRRYPALGFLLAAALLASMLPSALRLPLSGPSASAELAPVPGKSDGQGDLSALNASSTGGLGSGAGVGGSGGDGSGGGGPDPDPPDLGTGRNVPGKRCVAGRQTEDPLSPTCVAVFTGDNGGATSQGVTRDEVRLVVMNCTGDGRSVYDVSDRSKWGPNDFSVDEAYLRYFNERYQTYGRRVRLFRTTSGDKDCASLQHQREQLQNLRETLDPFMAFVDGAHAHAMKSEAARMGIMVFESEAAPRRDYVADSPFRVGYQHDLDDVAANVAEAVCARLAGRTAKFAGDPTMHDKPRKFGVLVADADGTSGAAIRDGLQRVCARATGDVVVGFTDDDKLTDADETDQSVTRLRTMGVTTVIFRGSPADLVTADAQKWYPEWLRLGDYVGENGLTRRGTPPTIARTGLMGLMHRRRLRSTREQYHAMALAEGNCQGACNTPTVAEQAYDKYMLIFTGIQAAGPRLSATAFDRGMRALPARQSRNPFDPSAYFAPGNHTFLKDFAFAWWDAGAQPPGGSQPGCWRLVEDGLRYRAEDWRNHPGDQDIHAPGQPCQADAGDL